MVQLLVLPQSVMDYLTDKGTDLSELAPTQKGLVQLATQDLADIEFAQRRFPFRFDNHLGITLAPSPVQQLVAMEGEDSLAQLQRVRRQIAQDELQDTDTCVSVYTLNPVSEHFWVAVEQRGHTTQRDPSRAMRSVNCAFFSSLIAQRLQVLPFPTVCDSNLFTYYVDALPISGDAVSQ